MYLTRDTAVTATTVNTFKKHLISVDITKYTLFYSNVFFLGTYKWLSVAVCVSDVNRTKVLRPRPK